MTKASLDRQLNASRDYYARRLATASSLPEQICLKKLDILTHLYQELTGIALRLRALDPEFFYKYNADQPRAPAGNSNGGQWTSDDEGEDEGEDEDDLSQEDDGSMGSDADDSDNPDSDVNSALPLPSSYLAMDNAGYIYQLPDYTDQNATAPESWANPDISRFEDHFYDHGADFGSNSPEDYANQANQFYNMAQEAKLPSFETTNGYIKIYDPETNTFGVYDPEGKTATFFKPSSPTYYERQAQMEVAKGGTIIEPMPTTEPIVDPIVDPVIETPVVPEIFIP